MQKQIDKMIDQCLALGTESSKISLSPYFARFQKEESIARISELDQAVFLRMYGHLPSSSEALKIRYWRCGYHLPANRTEMIRLAFALCLTAEETNHLLQTLLLEPALYPLDCKEFLYHSLLLASLRLSFPEAEEYATYYAALYQHHTRNAPKKIVLSLKEQFSNLPMRVDFSLSHPSADDLPIGTPDWKKKADAWMEQNFQYFQHSYELQNTILLSLCHRYLIQTPDKRLDQLKIYPNQRFQNLRHFFYCDVQDCLWNPQPQKDYYRDHTYSLDISSEINRYFKPGERISRSTLIRLFLVFTMPELDICFLNVLLTHFGYAPLNETIRTASGACLDSLLLALLALMEKKRTGNYEYDKSLQIHMFSLLDKSVNEHLEQIPTLPKGSVLYKKRQQLKDFRIMAFPSFRKKTMNLL